MAQRIRLARSTDDPGYARILGQLLTEQRNTPLPTHEQLEQLARITPADITTALRLARQHDHRIDAIIALIALRLRSSTQQYLAGAITLAEWNRQQLVTIKLVQVAVASIACGGKQGFTPQRVALTQALILQQYQYQTKYLADVTSGRQRQNGRMLARSALYAAAARLTYTLILRRGAQEQGMRYERNVLGPTDASCDACIQQADLGWVPVGTLTMPGTRTCLANCLCTLSFSDAPSRHEAALRTEL